MNNIRVRFYSSLWNELEDIILNIGGDVRDRTAVLKQII